VFLADSESIVVQAAKILYMLVFRSIGQHEIEKYQNYLLTEIAILQSNRTIISGDPLLCNLDDLDLKRTCFLT
jgi:hypothetical protein